MTATAASKKPLTDPPDPRPRKPRLKLPSGAWDCLIHVYGPLDPYPFHPLNPYRSAPALPETYLAQQEFLGLDKAVIVNGAGYGSDSRYLLDTLERYPQRFRGVTYVEPDVQPAALAAMRAKGLRGARFAGGPAYAHLPTPSAAIARKLADADWHLEFLTFTPGGTGKKAGATIGTIAGAAGGISAALAGATTGASLGIVVGAAATPSVPPLGAVAGAIVGGLSGGIAGCAVGAALGEAVDESILRNRRCLDCSHTFTVPRR